MADPKNKAAASSNQEPGNGDAWGTIHDKKDGSASAESSKQEQAGAEGAEEAKAEAAEAAQADEELRDAVLEAEAEAIIDEAMDAARAEAQAEGAQAQVDAAKKEVAEWKDKYMRLHAEWDTYRRRQKEQAETNKALAAEKIVSSLIPVVDDLERTIDYARQNGETGLLGGVEAVLAKFTDTLKKDGVVIIDPAGEEFNALEAQAVGTVPNPDVPDETVAEVYQRGYKIANKVLRPAMVTVTTGGPARPKEKKEDAE